GARRSPGPRRHSPGPSQREFSSCEKSTRRATRVGSARLLRYTARIDQLPLTPRPTPRDVLTGVFGYQDFRPGQEKIIATVLGGRDCIGVMPTGAGKSLTFQIPARLLPGTVLVVSPLISLMKDQVDALTRNAFRATVINSTLDWETKRDRLRRLQAGEYELAYVAPEGLEGNLRGFLGGVNVSLVVVDEAHCISEWGHDFRPAYRKLKGLKQELGGIPILALTATATRRVAGDIIRQLGMVKPDGFKGSFFRSNLVLTAHKKGDGRGSRKDLLTWVRRRAGESGIIYTLSRRNVESLTDFLRAAGVRAVAYQDGIEDDEVGREARRKTRAMYELADAPGCRWRNLIAYFDETIAACGASCDECRGVPFTELVQPAKAARAPAAAAPAVAGAPAADGALFQRLRALRRALADAEGVPAYIVFSDAVLARMAAERPTDEAGLPAVAGGGPAKLARYGHAFLRVLREADGA